MTFTADMARFAAQVKTRNTAVYAGTAAAIHASIKDGSPVTGAPGQPVDSGFLRNSWTLAIGPTEANIQTNVAYAPVIEYNDRSQYNAQGQMPAVVNGAPRRAAIKSTVGGNHSVKLTIAGASALQRQVLREVTA